MEFAYTAEQEELIRTLRAFARKELARALAQKSGAASRTVKRLVDQGLDLSLADGLELELRLAGEHMRSADAAEGLRAFAEKRTPVFNTR